MYYFDVILLSDVISSIGTKISDADTYINLSNNNVYRWQMVIHLSNFR